ncbi:hypothetical protein [Sediminicoccus rosea]|jgi:hypothetical protein|uniref:Uncharacterized protein n=1 Tax=Sediminicoccus rosea TaxID=1225128 RepID=A0ABZ0PIE0_9PROT|nr:hypothetical protein [Sediminicoccus rosea]WPB85485.1 hypothetical protein R9Z33_01105 [Sediminicoccus rosea]
MWRFSFFRSLGLMARTWPFLLLQVLLHAGIVALHLALITAGAGLGQILGLVFDPQFLDVAMMLGGAAGAGLAALLIHQRRARILHELTAAHLAAMVTLLEGGTLPAGRAQIGAARALVAARFPDPAALLRLEGLLRRAMDAALELLHGLTRRLIQTTLVSQLLVLLRATLRFLAGPASLVIIAQALRPSTGEPWAAARQGLILYAQNIGAMMRNRLVLLPPTVLLVVGSFALLLAPSVAIARAMPGDWSGGGLFLAMFLAWAVKRALMDPFNRACLLQVFLRHPAGPAPDALWLAHMERDSPAFRELSAPREKG